MKEKTKHGLIIVLGNLLYSIAVTYFILPFDILSGGVAGIGLIIEKLFSIDAVICIDVLVVLAFIFGYFFLGKDFALKTLLSTIVYPMFITLLDLLPYKIEADPILLALFGGMIAGIGIGMITIIEGSSGGTDVFAAILTKYTHIPISITMALIDGLIALGGLIAYGPEDVMQGLLFIFVTNIVVDKVMLMGAQKAICLHIITDKKDEVANYIHNNLERGTTELVARGGFTKKEKDVLLVIISIKEYPKLTKKIEEIDANSFVIVTEAKEIRGEGFSKKFRI